MEENASPRRELSLRAILIAIVVTLLLTSANIYLGMKAGITISASIPAAIIALGALRLFRDHDILEANMVQTAASTGEALAAGMLFTVPAFILLGYWFHFPYWQTAFIAITGGLLGVVFSIPLRKVLLRQNLPFPEGTAIGHVLLSHREKATGLNLILQGGLIAATLSFLQNGLRVFSEQMKLWVSVKHNIVGFSLGFNPALIGAGYIIGPKIARSICVGLVLGWLLGIPILNIFYGPIINSSPDSVVQQLYASHLRFIGLGMFFIGGMVSLSPFIKPILQNTYKALSLLKQNELPIYENTNDLPMAFILVTTLFLSGALWLLIQHVMNYQSSHLSMVFLMLLSICLVFFILVVGFVLATVCGYLVGLLGSSSSPISALSMIAIILSAIIIYFFLHLEFDTETFQQYTIYGASFAILTSAFIATSGAITNDTIQDMKAGEMIGASPYKQQLIMMLGVIVAGLFLPVIFNLLLKAYGMNDVNSDNVLAIPQAQLMATIARGIFDTSINWQDIFIGVGLAGVIQVFNLFFLKKENRFMLIAVALGMYLPLSSSTALVIGGIVSSFVKKYLARDPSLQDESLKQQVEKRGILFASGVVAGSALMGIILAIPHVLFHQEFLSIMSQEYLVASTLLSLLATMTLCFWIYHIVCRVK